MAKRKMTVTLELEIEDTPLAERKDALPSWTEAYSDPMPDITDVSPYEIAYHIASMLHPRSDNPDRVIHWAIFEGTDIFAQIADTKAISAEWSGELEGTPAAELEKVTP